MDFRKKLFVSVAAMTTLFGISSLARSFAPASNYHRNSERPQYRGYEKNNDCNKNVKHLVKAEMKKEVVAHGAKVRLLNDLRRDFSASAKRLQGLHFKVTHEYSREWRLLLQEKTKLIKKLKILAPSLKKKAVELSHYDLEYLRDRVKNFVDGVSFISQ